MEDRSITVNRFIMYLSTALKYILATKLFIIAILAFYQVIMRYIFKNPSSWTEELIRFLFVWLSFVGAAVGIKERIHIGIDVLVDKLSNKLQEYTAIFVHLLIIAFAVMLILYGWELSFLTHKQTSPALKLPMSYVNSASLVGGILIIIFSTNEIINRLKKVMSKC